MRDERMFAGLIFDYEVINLFMVAIILDVLLLVGVWEDCFYFCIGKVLTQTTKINERHLICV